MDEPLETWRPRFHIAPAAGRLNDPNGMLLDGSRLHVFYQLDPYFPTMEKRTGWGHASVAFSPLESSIPRFCGGWIYHPDALTPNHSYDRDGCYSGSAVRDDAGDLHFFYTGNRKDDGVRHPTVNGVDVQHVAGCHGGFYRRNELNPLLDGVPEGYTGHVRDPHVTRDPESPGGGWRMVLGAQRADETGTALLYRSADLDTWEFAGEITMDTAEAERGDAPDIVPGGYMWECPNLLRMRDAKTGLDKDVLVFCPQGLAPKAHHYASSDQCGYIVGRLEGTTFHVERGFCELDLGHEFYAPQLIAASYAHEPAADCENPAESDEYLADTVIRDAIMVGWCGLPAADDQPTAEDGWAHVLTMPRRVRLIGGRLVQEFIMTESIAADIASGFIDSGELPPTETYGSVAGLRAPIPAPKSRAHLSVTSAKGVEIPVDMMRNRAGDLLVRVDRSQQNYHAGADVRGVMILADAIEDFAEYSEHGQPVELLLCVDASVLEIQVAGYTLTSRVFLDRGDSWVAESSR